MTEPINVPIKIINKGVYCTIFRLPLPARKVAIHANRPDKMETHLILLSRIFNDNSFIFKKSFSALSFN